MPTALRAGICQAAYRYLKPVPSYQTAGMPIGTIAEGDSPDLEAFISRWQQAHYPAVQLPYSNRASSATYLPQLPREQHGRRLFETMVWGEADWSTIPKKA